MDNPILTVRSDSLIPGLSCQLCNNLLKEATKIYLCFHTFCRKCICDKITNEDLTNCPICNVDLGDTPLNKMRRDLQLQKLRNKLFPLKEKKKAPTTKKKKRRATRGSTSQSVPNVSIEEPSKEKEETPNEFSANGGQELPPYESKPPMDNEGENNGAEGQEAKQDF